MAKFFKAAGGNILRVADDQASAYERQADRYEALEGAAGAVAWVAEFLVKGSKVDWAQYPEVTDEVLAEAQKVADAAKEEANDAAPSVDEAPAEEAASEEAADSASEASAADEEAVEEAPEATGEAAAEEAVAEEAPVEESTENNG